MQIKFLTLYGQPIYAESMVDAQCRLLSFWQRSLENSQVKPIRTASIEFSDYAFIEYYDQEKLLNTIDKSVGRNYNTNTPCWYANGKRYEYLESLYEDLSSDNRLMELTITTEDY